MNDVPGASSGRSGKERKNVLQQEAGVTDFKMQFVDVYILRYWHLSATLNNSSARLRLFKPDDESRFLRLSLDKSRSVRINVLSH
jgi:hypothetical protein